MAGMTFSREKNRVEVDAYGLMISEIRAIWERDRTRTREKATAIISYVHIAAQIDPEAPFFGAKEEEVKILAAKNIWRNNAPRNLESYDADIVAYQEAYETSDARIVKSFSKKIDQMKKLLDETDPIIVQNDNPTTGITTFASNNKIITDLMKEIGNLMDHKEQLEQRLKKQNVQAISTLGQKKPSMLESKDMTA